MKNLSILLMIAAISPAILMGQATDATNGILISNASEKGILEIRTPDNLACTIDITAHPQKTVEVNYNKWTNVKSEEARQRYFSLIEIGLDENAQDADGLRLRILTPTKAPWEGKDAGVRVNLNIKVPQNFKIDSNNSYSQVNIVGPLSDISVNNEYGAISAIDIKGEVVIKTSYSDIKLEKIEGGVDVQTSYSDIIAKNVILPDDAGLFETSYGVIWLDNIKGPLEANTSYDSILASNLESPEGSIVLRTSYGKIVAQKISGELICETSYNPVVLTDVSFTHGVNNIETRYSPIKVSLVKIIDDAQLTINNTYSNIDLTLPQDISARLTLAVDRGGKIHTIGIPIKPLVMEKSRLEGILGGGTSLVELNVNGIGEINIESR
jgi:hypothetical protein